jgi:hypothetical protein
VGLTAVGATTLGEAALERRGRLLATGFLAGRGLRRRWALLLASRNGLLEGAAALIEVPSSFRAGVESLFRLAPAGIEAGQLRRRGRGRGGRRHHEAPLDEGILHGEAVLIAAALGLASIVNLLADRLAALRIDDDVTGPEAGTDGAGKERQQEAQFHSHRQSS